ncbi:MAG TPA: methyltransferase domain-containing protein [Micromonosporaceae bacterium]
MTYPDPLAAALAGRPDVDQLLRRPGSRIAEIGCRAGASSFALARAFPQASVEGWDTDRRWVDLARTEVEREGLADRVVFSWTDGSYLRDGWYDVIFVNGGTDEPGLVGRIPRPVLEAARRALRPGGTMVQVEAGGESAAG